MKFLPFVWSMLWRSKARTWLTFLSIAVAFLLFGLLQAVTSAFDAYVKLAGADRLIVTGRTGIKPLPYAYRAQIESLDGVRAVNPTLAIGGWYQDPKNTIRAIAMDSKTLPDVDSRFIIPPEQLKAFQQTRVGAIAGRDLAEKYGWKIGDRIPLTSSFPRKDGSQNWEFELVGLFSVDERILGRHAAALGFVVNYDYVSESSALPGIVLWYEVRIRDARQVTAVGKAIDRLFQNSAAATKTQTEAEFTSGFIKRIGDVGRMVNAIVSTVFFTLILVAGSAMMRAFRERVPELAVLKTLGFTDRRVAGLVVGESLLLCVTAAAIGLGLAMALVPPIRQALPLSLANFAIEDATLAAGIGLAAALGFAVALIPAWKSARLSVIAALAVA